MRSLLKVEREIVIYEKGKEGSIKEVSIDNISFEELKKIVSPKEDDPHLYDGYILNEIQLEKINNFNSLEINPDFKKYLYVLECSGIYKGQDFKS